MNNQEKKKKRKRVRRDQWFVGPADGTDLAMANELCSRAFGLADNELEVGDDKGITRNVWQCRNKTEAVGFCKSEPTTHVALRLYTRPRTYGTIRDVTERFVKPLKLRAEQQVAAALHKTAPTQSNEAVL